MDENFEEKNANENLLSQSYCDGIQKVTGNDKASLNDFQIPAHLLELRKTAWNALFEKYSSNAYEKQDEQEEQEEQEEQDGQEDQEEQDEQEEQVSPEHEKEEEFTTNNNRFPMRKPMSMVQYWVDTGNQPYAPNNLEKSQSDSGSSLAEECLETMESINSPCQTENASLEKNYETNETSRNVRLRLTSSSSSSVDTAAYILANNNTTKKADTIAIVEGSKIVNEEPSHSIAAIDSIEKINQSKKDVSLLDNILFKLNSKELGTSISKNINKNMETVNNVNKNLENKKDNAEEWNNKSQEEESSDNSDESIFKSKYDFQLLTQNSVDQNNGTEKLLHTSIIENKTFKRKKLYNNTESPADFTPVSEDNASHLTLRIPVKKCDHPALETPRLSARPSYLVRYQRFKSRTKRKQRMSRSFKILQTQKSEVNNSNLNETSEEKNGQILNIRSNLQNLLQGNSQSINEVEENCDQNLKKTVDSSNQTKEQEDSKDKSDTVNKDLLNDSDKKAPNLKPLIISLQRLPHKYGSIEKSSLQEKPLHSSNFNKEDEEMNCKKNSSLRLPSKKNHDLEEVKITNFKNVTNGVSSNLTRNSQSDNIDSSATKSQRFSYKIPETYSKKSMNYIIAFSSSEDETELSVTNLRKSMQKLSKEKLQRNKKSLNVIDSSEKELLDSNSKVDDTNNKTEISSLNKLKNEIKKHSCKRKSDDVSKSVEVEMNKATDVNNSKSMLMKSINKSNSSGCKEICKQLSVVSSDEETIITAPTGSSVPKNLLETNKGNASSDDKASTEKFDQQPNNAISVNKNQKSIYKQLSLMSSDEETIITTPTGSSVPNKFLETNNGNASSGDKALKEKYDQQPNKAISLKKNQKPVKKSKTMKNFRYNRDISSSEEDLQLPVKSNFSYKTKLTTNTVKNSIVKSSSATEEAVTNSISDTSANSISSRKNENKINYLEERINKIKMNNQRTSLNTDSSNLNTFTSKFLQITDSSDKANSIENIILGKEIDKKKSLQNKKKRPYKEHSEITNGKIKNEKTRGKSKKENLSAKKPKMKSEIFMSSDEECIIPLKIK